MAPRTPHASAPDLPAGCSRQSGQSFVGSVSAAAPELVTPCLGRFVQRCTRGRRRADGREHLDDHAVQLGLGAEGDRQRGRALLPLPGHGDVAVLVVSDPGAGDGNLGRGRSWSDARISRWLVTMSHPSSGTPSPLVASLTWTAGGDQYRLVLDDVLIRPTKKARANLVPHPKARSVAASRRAFCGYWRRHIDA